MFSRSAKRSPQRGGRQRGASAVEFAIILPLFVSLLFGVIDFGLALAQQINLQGAARESARQGVTNGDVIATANQARGMLTSASLQSRFAVDTSGGNPGIMVVCLRYPQSSLTGFYSWALTGSFEAKAVMRMEGSVSVTSGASQWTGGSCAA